MVAPRTSAVVLLPVKSPAAGKSRLAATAGDDRALLAAAFARDVAEVAMATPGVGGLVVVSDDLDFAATLGPARALLCLDPGAGLNAALRAAAALAADTVPDARPVALLADLPALRPEDLASALAEVVDDARPRFVVDADGTGTTLYTAPAQLFAPAFGAGSAARHLADGAVPVGDAAPSLRRDVDDAESLAAAVALGVGPATAEVIAGAAR